MSKFLHDNDNDDAKAIATARVFSENSRAKEGSCLIGTRAKNTGANVCLWVLDRG